MTDFADFFQKFLSSFIPLFVAIDIVGVLPFFLSLTQGFTKSKKSELIDHATLTALLIAVVFLFTGKMIFVFLGISENDFRVAGGLLLLIISITDIVAARFFKSRRDSENDTFVGVVPIGIPLIMGPAAMTTLLISLDSYGMVVTLSSLAVNLLFVWITLRKADWTIKIFGEAGSRAIGKVMALFLAAIAIMMIRVGIVGLIKMH